MIPIVIALGAYSLWRSFHPRGVDIGYMAYGWTTGAIFLGAGAVNLLGLILAAVAVSKPPRRLATIALVAHGVFTLAVLGDVLWFFLS
jgi:hypothetical protein